MWRMVIAASTSAWLAGCSSSPTLITRDGALAPCEAPHCVSSLSSDPAYFIEPIRYTGTRDAARGALLRVLGGMEGAQVVTQTQDYVHAEFTSKIVHYVDDLELVFAAGERVVQVRSASRFGYYDFHVNRDRVETLRARFEELQP